MAVGQHLDFNVPGATEKLFHEHVAIAKTSLSLGACGNQRVVHGAGFPHYLHAGSPPTRSWFQKYRIADRFGQATRFVGVDHSLVATGNDREPSRLDSGFRRQLVAHHTDMVGMWADEDKSMLLDDVRKSRIFGEKTVTGVNGVIVGDLSGRNYCWNIQIAVLGRWWPDAHALVG